METFFDKVLKHPWLVLLASLIVVLATGYGAQFLTFKSDYRVFFGPDSAELNAFEEMQRIYSKSDNVAFLLIPRSGDVFTKDSLETIFELSEAAWQIPYATRVDSISNFQHTTADGDDLLVEDLLYDLADLSPEKMATIRQVALNDPILKNKVVAADGSMTIVNTTVTLPGVNQAKEVPEVALAARQIRDELKSRHPGMEIRLTGMVMMNNSFPEASQQDSATLIPAMFAVVFFSLVFLLRTVSGTVATFVVIIATIITSMGIYGWAGMFLSGPSATAPIMMLTLAVADCVHILTSMLYDMRHGMNKEQAIKNSLRINLQPIFLTSVTTAIGFLTMNFSDSPPFNHLGNLVGGGVMLAFIFSITTFPAVLTLLPVKARPVPEGKSDFMDRLASWVIRHRKALLPISALVCILMAAMIPRNELNDNFVEYFDQSLPFRQATDRMQEKMSGLVLIETSIQSQESSGINEPAFLQVVEDYSNWLREQPETDHVNTLTDILKRLNKNMHGDDPAWYKLPDERELAAQYLLLYEMSLPYGLDLNNQLDVDKSATRVIATFKNISSVQILDLEERIHQWFKEHGQGYSASIASPSLMFAHIGQGNIKGMLTGTITALLLISALLGFALKSLRYGLLSLIPNLLPAAVGFGLWGLLISEVGLGLSVVASMTLGIVVDDTVHFLSKYLRARREKNLGSRDGVRYAFNSVGRALWVTTLVLVAGFLILSQSTFKVNADMGLLTGITILIALAVDFFLLPPLLILLDHNKNGVHHENA